MKISKKQIDKAVVVKRRGFMGYHYSVHINELNLDSEDYEAIRDKFHPYYPEWTASNPYYGGCSEYPVSNKKEFVDMVFSEITGK